MNKEEYAEKKLKVDSDTVDGVDYEREVLETSYEDGQKDILAKFANLVRPADQIANMSNTNIPTSVMHDLQTALANLKNGFQE